MNLDEAANAFREFVAIIKALRTPVTGCPWDLEQDHQSLRPYLVEEAYEVLEAIDRGDDRSLREELGDLLLQVVLHAQVADDRGAFSITEVVRGIAEKMVRRHPHVFGSVRVSGSAELLRNWEQIKAAEKAAGGAGPPPDSPVHVPESLPALLRAQRVGEKAAKLQPEPDSPAGVLDEVRRKLTEVERDSQGTAAPHREGGAAPVEAAERREGGSRARLEQEFGDLLFGLCRLANSLGVDAEASLRGSTRRFLDRFRAPGHQARKAAEVGEATADDLGKPNGAEAG